jgi:hypothetical protein
MVVALRGTRIRAPPNVIATLIRRHFNGLPGPPVHQMLHTKGYSTKVYVSVDGTHLKGGFVHTLMLAVRIDAENQIVPLAWAVVESENERSWRWFLSHLSAAIPQLDGELTTLISDRDKGLQAAEDELEHVKRAFCVQHIAANVQTKYGIEARRKFVSCTCAQ